MATTAMAASILGDVERHRRLMSSVSGANPALDAFRSQQERQSKIFASFSKSSALDAFVAQKRPADLLLRAVGKSGAFEAFTGRNGKWFEQAQGTVNSSRALAALSAQQEERHRQLLASVGKSPAIEQAYRSWKFTLPSGMAEQMANFQSRMLADLVIESPPFVEDDSSDEVWFGEESWSALVFHMVAILKAAELMTAGMTGAKMELHAPVPTGVIYLLAVFIAAGELAAHFAKSAAKGMDEPSEGR